MREIKRDDDLIELGFKKYPKSGIDNESVVAMFQKRFDDEIGKKYFLDCRKWDFTWARRMDLTYSYEFSTQLYAKGTHEAINLTFLSKDYDEVVAFIEDMFTAGIVEHYELRD